MSENYEQPFEPTEPTTLGDDVTATLDEHATNGVADDDSAAGRRGRPRDPKAMERDEQVKTALADGTPKTREQLATELGIEGNLVYLSLWRLKRDNVVVKTNVEGIKRAWQLVGAQAE